MAKFVCPECDEEMSNGRSDIIDQAIDHMREVHDQNVSRDHVQGHIKTS